MHKDNFSGLSDRARRHIVDVYDNPLFFYKTWYKQWLNTFNYVLRCRLDFIKIFMGKDFIFYKIWTPDKVITFDSKVFFRAPPEGPGKYN